MTTSRIALVALNTVLAAAVCSPAVWAAPQAGEQKPVAPSRPPKSRKPVTNRYTLAYPESNHQWKVGAADMSGQSVSESLSRALEQKLSAKGYYRVKVLDFQCCAIQVEIQDVASPENSTGKSQLTLAAKLTVLDIDKQHLYSNEYRGEASGSPATGDAINAAASQLAGSVLADPAFMKALSGK